MIKEETIIKEIAKLYKILGDELPAEEFDNAFLTLFKLKILIEEAITTKTLEDLNQSGSPSKF